LVDWLACNKFSKALRLPPIDDIRKLCNLIAASNSHVKSSLGLEFHHVTHALPDLSLFGRHSLLHVSGITYPSFASDWEAFITANYSQMENNIIAEFDHGGSGYKLMGFFQSYSGDFQNLECALDSIRFYANHRQKELMSQFGQKLPATGKAISMIERSIKAIGAPVYIGFIDRGICAVKLITNVTNDNLLSVVEFCHLHFHHVITRQLQDLNVLHSMLQNLLARNLNVRLSLDVDLLTADFHDKLSFECMTDQDSLKKAKSFDKTINGLISPFSFERYFVDYPKSLELENSLPCGERRPSSVNLIDSEIFCVQHSHRKFLLTPTNTRVKDYLLASSFNLNQ
jgi:hypothetical protein